MMPRPQPRRFKVQRRVNLFARDRTNRRLRLGTVWLTVTETADRTIAEALSLKQQHDHPKRKLRVAEEWPAGSDLRPLR